MHESYKLWLENGQHKVFCTCGCNKEIIVKTQLIPLCRTCHGKLHSNRLEIL